MQVLGRADSSNVQAVMWGAAELGLAPERLDYGHRFGGTDTDAFRAMNPNGLVPVLRDGDLTLFESAAILRYLAARHGEGGPLWPADPAERARIDQWAEWGKNTFASGFQRGIFMPLVRTPAATRDGAALDAATAAHLANCAILTARLGEGPYVCGAFSLADVMIGHVLYRHEALGVEMSDGLRAYYDRLTERQAFAEHVMVPFDALRHPDA